MCLVARRNDALQALQKQIQAQGGRAYCYPCDISDQAACQLTMQHILADHPKVDVLVNNAARSIRRPITEATDRLHDYQRTINLNYLAPVHLTLLLLPHFIAQQRGHIVNVSSLSTQLPIPLFSAYLASKSALESFTRSLQVELGPSGISTTLVYFPMVRTPMSGRTDIYKHMRMLSPTQAASWVVKAVNKKPYHVSKTVGLLSQIAMSVLPNTTINLLRPMFDKMDQKLATRGGK